MVNIFQSLKNFFPYIKNIAQKNEQVERKSNYVQSILSNYQNSDLSDELLGNFSNNHAYQCYIKNPVAFRAVNIIAHSICSIGIYAVRHNKINGKNYLLEQDHLLSKLINTPNTMVHCGSFLEQIAYNLLIFGNAFILKVNNLQNLPKEMYVLDPQNMSVLFNSQDEKIYGFKYRFNNGSYKEYMVDLRNGQCDVLHLKNFHPNDRLYGLSPFEAAFDHIRQHNYSTIWNRSLLKNGARPSGAFFLKQDQDGGYSYITSDQMAGLQRKIDQYCGINNAGKSMIIQGPLEWKDFNVKPKDLDFLSSDKINTKHIANALGVPIQLLNDQESTTYNNIMEAKSMLYEFTVIPLLNKIICSLFNNWICIIFNNHFKNGRSVISNKHVRYSVTFNINEIPALFGQVSQKLGLLNQSNFMTINEKRSSIGLDPIDDGDKI